MKIGLIGLGKMGNQMARRLIADGHHVVVRDVNQDAVNDLAKIGASPSSDYEDMFTQLGENPIIWLMIPSQFVTAEVDKLLDVAPKNSLIIDGGNSNFKKTMARAEQAKAAGSVFMDVGVSGGISGLENGFSMMVGGPKESYDRITPILKSLGQKNGYNHFGPSGAGHFVKMVHNGIEYGMMEAYAEGYHILKENPFNVDMDMSAVAKVWQHGSIIESSLNGLAEEFFAEDNTLESIPGAVSESGEARWTLEYADENNIPAWVIRAAFDRRIASQNGNESFATKFLNRMRNAFGGHSTTTVISSEDR